MLTFDGIFIAEVLGDIEMERFVLLFLSKAEEFWDRIFRPSVSRWVVSTILQKIVATRL